MEEVRAIALDVGTRRVGVAVADPAGMIAMPHATVEARDRRKACAEIAELIASRQVDTVVVGWPLDMDGGEGRATRRIERFVDALERALEARSLSPQLVRWDERLTTTSAEAVLLEGDVSRRRRRDVIDQIAASHILEGWLRSHRIAREGEQ